MNHYSNERNLIMSPEEIQQMINNLPAEQREQLLASLSSGTAGGVTNSANPSASLFEKYVAKECRTDEERNSLTADVNSFWERLNSYMTPQRQRAYGLAVGRVQSGKTRNYIGLMFKAIDEGYNTIIILTSKNSRLAVQTHKRVAEWFGDGEKGLGIPNSCFLSRVRMDADGVENGVEWLGGSFQSQRVHVGIVLKNESGHLEQIREWLTNVGSSCGRMRMLVIDDESDSATPNTRSVSDPKIDSDADVSRYADIVRAQCPFLPGLGEEKGARIAEWMEQLLRCNVADDVETKTYDMLREKLGNEKIAKSSLMDFVRESAEFKQVTGLDAIVAAEGQNWSLTELVCTCFNKKATKRNPLNWAVLRDLFFYKFGVKQERSRINRSICEIAGLNEAKGQPPCFNYGKMIYVGYTATPFANMLNEDPTKDPLCPDCIQPLTPSSRYFGLQRIFGGSGDACNMNIVRAIEEDEYKAWVEPIQSQDEDGPGLGEDYSEDLIRQHDFAEEGQPQVLREVEWKSLKQAIQWAFCTAAARRVKRLNRPEDDEDKNEIKNRWTTMLFNLSHLSNQEDGVHRVQQRLVQHYINYVTRPENREEFVNACRRIWEDETGRFSREDFRWVCAGYGEVADYPTVDDVEGAIRDWFLDMGGKVKVIQVNSAVENEPSMDYTNPRAAEGDVLWIICGGNAISRGLTLEGLTVSYYDRIKISSAVDTITQMGRWFGYRPGYELLPRIWMTPATIAEMKNICRVEESLHGSLLELYWGEDTTSIRKGRNIASVLFFGRRLSGRDSNGIKFSATASKRIFNHVKDVNDHAMGLTREFLNGCGDRFDIQTGSTKALNVRHKLFWRNVEAGKVCDYIARLKDAYFARESIYDAEGVIREIKNSQSQWNVVVGNPETDRSFGENEGMFAGLGIRNNPFRRGLGAEVYIGTGQWTSNAFLARMPDKLMDRAFQALGQNVRPGDMRHVEKTFELAVVDEQLDRALVNPTLLIDFTKGDDDKPYVQVSFYWHGHSEESFLRAMVNPSRPTFVPQAIEIVNRQNYASFYCLCRLLNVTEKTSEDEFYQELQNECVSASSSIGEIDESSASFAWLQPKVFYSRTWAATVIWPQNIGMKIGYHLYRRILDNNWNNYGANARELNFHILNNNNFDNIIVWGELAIGNGYWWKEFAKCYDVFDRYEALCEECRKQKDIVVTTSREMQRQIFPSEKLKRKLKRALDDLRKLEGGQKFPFASYWLGRLCINDRDQAERHYRNASVRIEDFVGHAGGEAELVLAEMYYYGRGRDNDRVQAREWFQKARELGNTVAGQMLQQLEF